MRTYSVAGSVFATFTALFTLRTAAPQYLHAVCGSFFFPQELQSINCANFVSAARATLLNPVRRVDHFRFGSGVIGKGKYNKSLKCKSNDITENSVKQEKFNN